MRNTKFEIWKDGHLFLTIGTRKDADRIYDLMRKLFNPKPRVVKLYEKVTTTKLLRDNDKVYNE